MAKNKRISGIDIDEDIGYQEREWKVQRIGWVVIWLLLLAALLGVFGKGVLSDAQAADPTQVLSVKYARFERYRSPTTIELIIGPTLTGAGKFAIALNREFVDRVSIDRIDPEPESVKSDSNRLLYEFEVEAQNQPAHVYINYEYAQFGPSEVRINVENGPGLALHQFVYP